ncbi:hypothetical protein Acr_24g0013000 [Actinidia rufa]|uniref:DUF7356 domain-containing protein n=1 Tax=Actinidia rufa TaxID=165716 RepID=A0A7J0GW86_9ERIC|nr:hypothetical protein Acr_24g0013000 [Actinidia rufa]
MCRKLIILMGLLLILIVPGESKASLIKSFLKLTKNPNQKPIQIPPSPSPDPSPGFNSSSGRTNNIGGGREGDDSIITDERCETSAMTCHDLKNMTACLSYTGSGQQGSFLIVQNDEDNSLQVNWTILPSKIPFNTTELQKHQAKKVQINISEIVGASHSIVLNAGNGDCIINIGSPSPEDNSHNQIPSITTFVKPMHGAYLLALIVLVSGGACAFYKLRQRERHLDGVPYQELEMGQPENHSAVNVETAGGWNQDWDDDWDEEKAVKSPGGKHLRNGHANGAASKSSNNRWMGK